MAQRVYWKHTIFLNHLTDSAMLGGLGYYTGDKTLASVQTTETKYCESCFAHLPNKRKVARIINECHA